MSDGGERLDCILTQVGVLGEQLQHGVQKEIGRSSSGPVCGIFKTCHCVSFNIFHLVTS